MNNWTYINVITTTLNDQNHILEICIGSVIIVFCFDRSPIRLHGEGGVYDLYSSQPPGGDQRARSFTFKDEWDRPAENTIFKVRVNWKVATIFISALWWQK